MRQQAAQEKGAQPPLSELLGDPVPAVDACTYLLGLLIVGVVSLLVTFGLIKVAEYFRPPTQLQTSARIACALPSEHESLLLYVNAKPDGSIDVACGPMVGTRGSYPGARR